MAWYHWQSQYRLDKSYQKEFHIVHRPFVQSFHPPRILFPSLGWSRFHKLLRIHALTWCILHLPSVNPMSFWQSSSLHRLHQTHNLQPKREIGKNRVEEHKINYNIFFCKTRNQIAKLDIIPGRHDWFECFYHSCIHQRHHCCRNSIWMHQQRWQVVQWLQRGSWRLRSRYVGGFHNHDYRLQRFDFLHRNYNLQFYQCVLMCRDIPLLYKQIKNYQIKL